MSKGYAQEIVEALNWLLKEQGRPSLEINSILFVMDTDVSYEGEWTVPASKLIRQEQLDELIKPIITGGPSWIHAYLLPTTDHQSLITLRFGASIGNPTPSINVSIEINWFVKVIEDK